MKDIFITMIIDIIMLEKSKEDVWSPHIKSANVVHYGYAMTTFL